jgi:glycosyltransferase involved in cell wall biosynthesis
LVRVLYLNPFSQQVSGPDESLLSLLGALIPMGVEAHLVLPRPGPTVPRYEALGVKVHYAPLTVLKRRLGLGALLLPFRLARGVAAVARIVRGERVDLIHTNMEVVLDGAVASRLLRIPHILHYRGNTLDRPGLVFSVLARFWTATAEKIICISKATAEIFRKRGLGAKVEVVYNPVDVDAFARAERSDEVRRELGARPGDLLVGTVGRIHPRKDVATFLRAGALVAKEIPGLKLVVVGSAEAPEEVAYHNELLALSRELGIESRLCWAGARRDMPRVLKALDVFVLCSRHEGFGRVVPEAVAAGVFVVGSREGALPELVPAAHSGLLASAGDPEDFARNISIAVHTPRPITRAIAAEVAVGATNLRPTRVASATLATYRTLTPATLPAMQ